LLVLAAIVLIAGAPLGNFFYQAGIRVEQIGDERIRSWSMFKVVQMVAESPARYSREIFWTSAIGLSSATLAVAIAAPLGWLARRGGWRAAPALAVAVAGLAVPGPLIGLGLIALLNREDSPVLVWLYDRSLFAPIAAALLRALPWAILIIWLAFRSIPAETLESAELDGAGPMARFLRIGAPQRPAAFALAWLLSLVISTGDLAASILVIPPGIDTLPVRIFGLIHAGVDDQVAAICLTIILAVLAAAAIGWMLVKRSKLPLFFSIR
jgi:iron(III) transport system permease protein